MHSLKERLSFELIAGLLTVSLAPAGAAIIVSRELPMVPNSPLMAALHVVWRQWAAGPLLSLPSLDWWEFEP
jgi:hypothetical protein